MKKIEFLNKIKDSIINSFDGKEIELYDFLYDNAEWISKEVNEDIEMLEKRVIDRSASEYKKLVTLILRENNIRLKIETIGELYYLVRNNINDNVIDNYKKVDFILNNIKENSKGYIFQEFVLLYLEDANVSITERKKVADGGLDIIGDKTITLLGKVEQKVHIYGQIKFYKGLVPPCYLKQLVKDRIYRVINERDIFIETKTDLFVSHRGVSAKAKEYAKKNNIIVMETMQIIMEAVESNKKFKCLEYIDREYRKIQGK